MGLCLSIAHSTSTIGFGTSIQPIYLQHPVALATSASSLHEVAGSVPARCRCHPWAGDPAARCRGGSPVERHARRRGHDAHGGRAHGWVAAGRSGGALATRWWRWRSRWAMVR
ncbi:hypothetical protein [Ilumatobacter sp.]|uniref:hypothetical protein n=1 Tax=Ilumatobacter sp. TaxID=1967498 RepID=UPI00345D8F59